MWSRAPPAIPVMSEGCVHRCSAHKLNTTWISNRWVSGYDWVTEILVWGYAPIGGRRPLFRVWGYAPTRESVISHILSHTMVQGREEVTDCDHCHGPSPKEHHGAPGGVHHDPSRVARRAAAAGYNLRRPLRRGREPRTCTYAIPGLSRPYSYWLIPFMEGCRSGVRGYALSGGHQTVHTVWGYACRAFRSPNHTLTPTYSKSCL